ncbi:hypothetical protein BUALT_Bualt09G0083100 [Buddleja alternifolia]|uniref:Uncharacterized protein n=1 Tax=Buddleja alternifolia TaxID=168488 RepID=A0AAV6X870_9LAMI|nr:hypothetical protein BUALT_Bualt09G0083100 [Buddleja alternifolia]
MFTWSMFKSNDEESEMDNENIGNLRDTVIVEVDGLMREKSTVLSSPNARKMEMKMSKKILLEVNLKNLRKHKAMEPEIGFEIKGSDQLRRLNQILDLTNLPATIRGNMRLKSRIVFWDKPQGSSGAIIRVAKLRTVVIQRMMFTRSVFKSNDEESEMDNDNLGNLRDTVVVEVDGFMREKSIVLSSLNARKMEMKMLKKILLKGKKVEPNFKSNEPTRPQSESSDRMDHGYVPSTMLSETNGFAVYTRNKRLKSRIAFWDKPQGGSRVLIRVVRLRTVVIQRM